MNPGNAFAVKKENTAGNQQSGAGATPSNVFVLQKKIEAVGDGRLVSIEFANRKDGGQDKSESDDKEKRESENGGGTKGAAARHFSTNPFANGAYFYEEARVMY